MLDVICRWRDDLPVVVGDDQEDVIRNAALQWLSAVTLDGRRPVSREQLANDFVWGGQRFPLIDRGRGIRKPAGWTAALSITSAVAKSGGVRPYEDAIGPDGLQRYKFRRDAKGTSENQGLRAAMQRQVYVFGNRVRAVVV